MINKDKWLSRQLKINCYNISYKSLLNLNLRDKNKYFYITNTLSNKKLLNLINKNFFYINTKNNYELILKKSKKLRYDPIFKKSLKLHMSEISHISKNSFIDDRFHKDQTINKKFADQIKKAWVENYFNGKRGDCMFHIEIKNQIAGFILINHLSKKISSIDLIAVKKEYRGKNLAKSLIENICKYLSNNNFQKLILSTQMNNINSMNLYNSLKFEINSIEYIFHR